MTNTPRRPRFDTEVQTARTEPVTAATETEPDDAVAQTALPTDVVPIVSAAPMDEAVAVATTLPTGADIDGGLAGISVGGITIDTEPDHLGVDLSVGGVTMSATVDDALTFGTAAIATESEGEDATVDTGLGPMPGTSLFANVGGKPLNEFDAKKPEVEEKAWYEKAWESVKEALTPDSDTNTGTGTGKGTLPDYDKPNKTYSDPEADVVGGDATIPSVVLQTVATGMDPTTTTPSGPSVDDGDAQPITADDIAGAPALGSFGVPLRPGVLEGDDRLDTMTPTGGDPGVLIDATGPDTVGPNDPVLGGAEPITADALSGPATTIANPIAGGEDEDLEDLEIQRLTPGSTPVTTSTAVEAFAGGEELALTSDLSNLSEAKLMSAMPAFDGPPPSGELEGFDDGLLDG